MGVLAACRPRPEVLSGDLKDAIFAADFGDVISGHSGAPDVYSKPELFFRNTHPARDLTRIVREVFAALSKQDEPGLAIRLSTGFGGGKTHTLLSLWHLAKNVGNQKLGAELLPATGRPPKVHVAAVDGAKAGHPVFAQHGGVVVKSLAGELAYQFGGAAAVKKLGAADDVAAQPTEAAMEAFLPDGPVLILLDELVMYLSGLDDQGRKNTLNVVNKLVAIAARRPQTVLVVTDPGAQPAYAGESADLGKVLAAAKALDELLGRKTTDFDPIGTESAKVIARRLFEHVDASAAQSTGSAYRALYGRVADEHPGLIPATARTEEYARRIQESYPFHPRLLDTARDRLGALADFQRSRGVLRLFARIIRDVWERGEDVDLITAGEIDFASNRIRSDLLQRLNKEQFDAAVSADVITHAGELDNGKRGIHSRVASALMVESLPATTNAGLTADDLTLAVLRPDEAGQEPTEALDHLIGTCWHTYPMDGGAGYQFRVEPNVRKQIEERRNRIPLADAESRVQTEAQQYFQGAGFKMRNWPEHANAVPDVAQFQVALCDSEARARSIAAHSDDRDPAAPIKRRFINAVVGVAPTESAYRAAVQRAQSLLAAEELEREYKTGDSGAMIREQLKRIKPELDKQFRVQARRAFDRVVLADGSAYAIDETFQGGDEQILKAPQGQQVLRRFLEDKELIYGGTDSLDPKLLVQKYLKGAVPVPGETDVWTATAVHERLLSASGLRLVPDEELTRRTLLRGAREGQLVLKLADGRAHDREGVVDGPPGARKRVKEGAVHTLALSDSVLVALSSTAAAAGWIAVDKEPGGKSSGKATPPPPPPAPAGDLVTADVGKAVEAAVTRPLVQLVLTSRSPAGAKLLSQLAQPFGASSISLNVSVAGEVKGGGTMGLSIEGVKHSHPVKPLDIAGAIANSLTSADSFEASLTLEFEPGLLVAGDHLKALADRGDDLRVSCRFGPSAATGA
ncbi:MAG TPA: DUF499 domain-containing protein [Gemmatimonadaceae bacterium]|nr:DUF499 domain-containing protein [Gemmatimonadaceae bacterium]